ncbi:prepilin-type N-terminal cleavage/methylation domain-containing protein [Pseudalkalibacillus hwajinpoensis]|uniref:Prepilin-type N-terminal cleavage/methylation domain-containing protein n=1 Tax=Guptibacillus hwajinpoensis TaxID=208199 RepID=A0A4U1MHX9_9BACL|nr:prepilin-type N-terminal cleavage/methylation domain-containing protein [Pseudalkalibacillus hwajinpoensis]
MVLNRHRNWLTPKGYTLIEMLIVLSAFSILLSLVFLQISPTQTASSTRHFIEEMQADIRYAQELSYTDGKSHRFSISADTHTYSIQSTASNVIKTRDIPKHISIEKGTLGYQIVFGANGNVQKAGTLFIKAEEEEYKLVVQVGAGRFYLEKL